MFSLFRTRAQYYIAGGLVSLGILFLVILILHNAPKKTAAAEQAACVLSEEALRSFLQSFGWQTDEKPTEVQDVLLPQTFGAPLLDYNELQKAQGYDLAPYCGKRVKKYVFRINNHPDDPGGNVCATVYVYNGAIIGGDVSTARIDGFMHGFRYAER